MKFTSILLIVMGLLIFLAAVLNIGRVLPRLMHPIEKAQPAYSRASSVSAELPEPNRAVFELGVNIGIMAYRTNDLVNQIECEKGLCDKRLDPEEIMQLTLKKLGIEDRYGPR